MSDKSAIQWTDASWNPVTGCSKVSPGCAHCYAETLSLRFGTSKKPWTPENAEENVVLHPERLEVPLRWKRPRMIFVNSMSDLFHPLVPFEFVARVWDVMFETGGAPGYERHIYQILTKRPDRLREFAQWMNTSEHRRIDYSNVWLGVSAENQRWADERIPILLDTPAAIRFVSAEPLLGPIDFGSPGDPTLTRYLWLEGYGGNQEDGLKRGLDWVIVGGESGPKYRPMNLDWARTIRDACALLGVPFFFKQIGGRTPKSGGRLLDGQEWNEMPV